MAQKRRGEITSVQDWSVTFLQNFDCRYRVWLEFQERHAKHLGSWLDMSAGGTLLDGTEFDSSYKRGKTTTFTPSRVVKGWTEALQLMKSVGPLLLSRDSGRQASEFRTSVPTYPLLSGRKHECLAASLKYQSLKVLVSVFKSAGLWKPSISCPILKKKMLIFQFVWNILSQACRCKKWKTWCRVTNGSCSSSQSSGMGITSEGSTSLLGLSWSLNVSLLNPHHNVQTLSLPCMSYVWKKTNGITLDRIRLARSWSLISLALKGCRPSMCLSAKSSRDAISQN